jgi:competence protein ComEC
MKILKIKLPLKGNLLYLALGLLMVSLIKDAFYMVGVLILYLWFLWRIEKTLVWGVILVGLIYTLTWSLSFVDRPLPEEGMVLKVHASGTRVLIRSKGARYWAYVDDPYGVGDVLRFNPTQTSFKTPDLLGAFDYPSYLKARGIRGSLFTDEVTLIDHRFTLHRIPDKVETYIEERFTFMRPYLKAFILADRSEFDAAFTDAVNALGVSHIFAISGLHITFVAVGLDTAMKKYVAPKPRRYGILIFLGFYGLLTGFTPSFIRASFLFGFMAFQSSKEEGYTPLDGLSIIFMGMMILRPYSLFDPGFVLSYLVTFGLLGMVPYLKGSFGLFKVSIIAFMMTLPIIMGLHGSVNVSSLFFNSLYVIALTFLILPASYIVFVFPFLEPILSGVIPLFETVTFFFYETLYFPITIPYLIGFMNVIYYGILAFLMAQPRALKPYLLMGLFLGVLGLIRPLHPYQQITLLDVDGDALIFEDRFQRCVGLIDGGSEQTAPDLIRHLKLKGYRHFDWVIVTHDHADHTGGIKALLKDPYFTVGELRTEVQATKTLNVVPCGHLQLIFYPWMAHPQTNNRSLVTGVFMDEFSFLSGGDIEKEAEAFFIDHNPFEYSALVLPHHGSNTSSTVAFLNQVNPQIAFVNLPHRNVHGFPHPIVISRLEARNIPYFTTEQNGTIKIRNSTFKP